jgi:hypothetical protein
MILLRVTTRSSGNLKYGDITITALEHNIALNTGIDPDAIKRAASGKAAAMFREQKHTSYLADALNNLGWVALLRGDSERARALYAESMRSQREIGSKVVAPENLLGLACVAAARGEAERAARLFGASEALSEEMGAPLEPGERALQESYLGAARSQLDETSWQEAWTQGRAMTLEKAISYALEEEEAAT